MNTTKMWILEEDWWPMLQLEEIDQSYSNIEKIYEIPNDLIDEYNQTLQQLAAVQEKLHKLTNSKYNYVFPIGL